MKKITVILLTAIIASCASPVMYIVDGHSATKDEYMRETQQQETVTLIITVR